MTVEFAIHWPSFVGGAACMIVVALAVSGLMDI